METLTEQLNRIGQALVDKLKEDIKTKPVTKYGVVNASGKLADSVRYEVYDNGVRVYALDYIYYLQFGRKFGKFPPRSVIRKWIDDKGINPTDISKDSLAFLIARKISRQGTTIFQQGGSDLVSGVIESEFFTNLTQQLIDTFVAELSSEILKLNDI